MTTEVIHQLNSYIELLIPQAEYFNEHNLVCDSTLLINILQGMLSAQENNDYILIADIYEIELNPFFANLQEFIISREGFDFNVEDYNNNLRMIEQMDSELGSILNSLPNPVDLLEQGYTIEPTSCGLMTLALSDNNRKYYLHSNNQVQKEAFTLANSWYTEEKTEYIIYGLGLGYHVTELFGRDNNITIEVYESDIHIIEMACAFSDLNCIATNQNIKLIYDPDFTKLVNKLSSRRDDVEFVLHYPSLRNIKNPIIKEKLENYFIQYSSIKNQLHLLNSNFIENILHFDNSVDELKEIFEGKNLFIVSAGPSLDKNFLQLKNRRENSLILATGTVFRKLINAEIIPDYIIVTDANPRVYGQINGLETKDIPMIFLSTAYQNFAKNYQGKKYMICQKDYTKAEEFAVIHGYNLYQTGGSVSTTALEVGIRLGCKRIIFLGLDLGFPDNLVHATGTSRKQLASTENLQQVPDIYGNLIYTTKVLNIYRKWIENRIKDVKEIEFIDASEGGAMISGMRIAKLSEV